MCPDWSRERSLLVCEYTWKEETWFGSGIPWENPPKVTKSTLFQNKVWMVATYYRLWQGPIRVLNAVLAASCRLTDVWEIFGRWPCLSQCNYFWIFALKTAEWEINTGSFITWYPAVFWKLLTTGEKRRNPLPKVYSVSGETNTKAFIPWRDATQTLYFSPLPHKSVWHQKWHNLREEA